MLTGENKRDAKWPEGSVVKAKAFGESRGQHLWRQNTFDKKLHSSVETLSRTGNWLLCLPSIAASKPQRPTKQPHELFYTPNECKPNTTAGYSPQRLVDKCTNGNVSAWSSFLTLTPNVTGFCSRNRQISNLISKPSLVILHAGFPWLFYFFL